MTGPGSRGHQPRAASASRVEGWQACLPELAILAGLIVTTAVAVYAYAGAAAAAITVVVWVAVLLVLMRWLLPAVTTPVVPQAEQWRGAARSSLIGYWRKMSMLRDGAASMASYDAELRLTLQHLAAARLAERHDVNFYTDPAAARRLLLGGGRADALWYWLDPDRPAETGKDRPGIPDRVLAAILDRLEQL